MSVLLRRNLELEPHTQLQKVGNLFLAKIEQWQIEMSIEVGHRSKVPVDMLFNAYFWNGCWF
jgi:hypothetical protein